MEGPCIPGDDKAWLSVTEEHPLVHCHHSGPRMPTALTPTLRAGSGASVLTLKNLMTGRSFLEVEPTARVGETGKE